jgi:hypothetical protein
LTAKGWLVPDLRSGAGWSSKECVSSGTQKNSIYRRHAVEKTGTDGTGRGVHMVSWQTPGLDHSQTVHDAEDGQGVSKLARPSLLGVFLEVDKLSADFPAKRDHHAGISKSVCDFIQQI